MKIKSIIVLMFVVTLLQPVFAQSRWKLLDKSSLWDVYIDTNIKQLYNGNLVVKSKYDNGAYVIYTTEINCVDRESRSLGESKYDSYGSLVKSGTETGEWKIIESTTGTNTVASFACRQRIETSPNTKVRKSKPKKKS